MEWLKFELKWGRSPEFYRSDPVSRATWLSLLLFCADNENGGRIKKCKNWPDRMWQQMCGVTLDETRQASDLFTWDEDDLIVTFYPKKTEKIVQSRREAGKAGASARWQKQDLPLAKSNFANAEQSRVEERRGEKSIAEDKPKASGRRGIGWDRVEMELALMNGKLPDTHRGLALAKECWEEMEEKKWVLPDGPVKNPMGLIIDRLKKDGAYKAKK